MDGGFDRLFGGSGAVDYIIGGGFDDYFEGNEGMDLVFGDHALVNLDASVSHKLILLLPLTLVAWAAMMRLHLVMEMTLLLVEQMMTLFMVVMGKT
mmetsp:Transcript_48841/g.73805  ORF Transcript_48841/g.73805 Transcript_48841/m.73805 type:complete len:96 (+) Transcript_48841:266-553(+)